LLLGRNTTRAMQQQIHSLCTNHKIDTVFLAWTEMGRYLDAVPPDIRTVLGTMDVERLVRPREVKLYPPGQACAAAERRAQHLIRIERQAVPQADAVTACSRNDQEYLQRLRHDHQVYVVPPYADLDSMWTINPDRKIAGQLTFFGALDRIANLAAAEFLINEVWPLIHENRLSPTLVIAGANPPPALERLASIEQRIRITGYIEDIRAMWAETDVAVLPSLIGGGLLTKAAQAMGAGRPVVTTTLGNEGIAAPPDAIAIADSAHLFANSILNLLTDRDAWRQMARAGRAHVLQTLDWDASMKTLEMVLSGK
jgi:polysaccharide biosynthesis protein PslH